MIEKQLNLAPTKQMVSKNIGFLSAQSKIPYYSKYNSKKCKKNLKNPRIEQKMRNSLLDKNKETGITLLCKEFQVSPPLKNYKSNKDLEFYKTAPTYDKNESYVNNCSVESLTKDQLNRKLFERSGSLDPEENLPGTDSFRSSNFNFSTKDEVLNKKDRIKFRKSEPRLSSLENSE
mmetsp:Transcript_30835/g.27275  ORF Transcript_30835/g.27275 Transcript_30835/m.27275 type:complete len:176 (-) Transcript_30835:479-1006(-)